jgi:triacylglycerol lipase
MGKEIKFHPNTFYMGIADMLAREVEGQGNQDGDNVRQVASPVDSPSASENDSHESERKRAQMLDSLDATGASVHDLNASKDSSSPSSSPPPLESGPRTSSKRDPPS